MDERRISSEEQLSTYQGPIAVPERCFRTIHPPAPINERRKHFQETLLNHLFPTKNGCCIPSKRRERLLCLFQFSVYLSRLRFPRADARGDGGREFQRGRERFIGTRETGTRKIIPGESLPLLRARLEASCQTPGGSNVIDRPCAHSL
jgi:hypothetical protein